MPHQQAGHMKATDPNNTQKNRCHKGASTYESQIGPSRNPFYGSGAYSLKINRSPDWGNFSGARPLDAGLDQAGINREPIPATGPSATQPRGTVSKIWCSSPVSRKPLRHSLEHLEWSDTSPSSQTEPSRQNSW